MPVVRYPQSRFDTTSATGSWNNNWLPAPTGYRDPQSSAHGYVPDLPVLTDLWSWWDASDTSTITDAGAGAVSVWGDKSGNARDLSQGTGGNRPTTGTRTINGLNVIDFSGTNQWMSLSGGPTQGWTMFVVALDDDGSGSPGRYLIGHTGAGNFAFGTQPTNQWFMYAGTIQNGAATLTTATHVLTTVWNGGTSVLRIDTAVDISASPGAGNPNGFEVGGWASSGGTEWNGPIAEIIVYDTELSSDEITAVEQYLITKWAITLAFDRTATDTLMGGDTATQVAAFTRTTTDDLLDGDTATRSAVNFSRTTTDTLLGADTADRAALAFSRTTTDTLLGGDTAAGQIGYQRTTTDTLLGGDTATRSALSFSRTTTDTLLGADTATGVQVFTRTTSDTLLGGDTA